MKSDLEIFCEVGDSIGLPKGLIITTYRQLELQYRQPSNEFREHENQIINLYMNEWLDRLRREYYD